ncbi:hypothetical protein ABT034_17300 [Streptomyces sp. NPDC002773]|uniref:hypothetical protein n=1 Tax=Streptomyces sp. NPDC002773 TaxID=3154430 RepID=UPI003329F483
MAAVSPESEEAGAVAPAEDGDAESGTDALEAAAGTKTETESGTVESDGAVEVVDAAERGDGAEDADGVDAEEAVAGAVAAEAVEIPKQQSAEAAADNEAGEGARR